MNIRTSAVGILQVIIMYIITASTADAQVDDWTKYSRSMEETGRLVEAMKGVDHLNVFVRANISSDKALKSLAAQKKDLDLMLADWVHLWLNTWLGKSTIHIEKGTKNESCQATFVILVFINPGLDGKGYALNYTAALWRKVVVFPPIATAVPFEVPVWESVRTELIPQQDVDGLKRRLKTTSSSLVEDFVKEIPEASKQP